MNLEKDSKKTKKLRPLSIYDHYYEPKDKAISIHKSKKKMALAFKPSKKNRFIHKKFENSRIQTVNDPTFNHVGLNYGGKKTRKNRKKQKKSQKV